MTKTKTKTMTKTIRYENARSALPLRSSKNH